MAAQERLHLTRLDPEPADLDLIIGPPGSSKSVGVIVPMLLDEPGLRSFVVIDPKGEVAAITSRYRRRVSDVKIINPYGLLVDG